MTLIDEENSIKHRRRHTIARPDSALALLTDSMNYGEDSEDNQFDRISHILSSLIQEANEAVNKAPGNSRPSTIPLVRKLSSSVSSDQQRYHKKRLNYRTTARPLSYPSSLRRSKTPSLNVVMNGTQSKVVNGNKKIFNVSKPQQDDTTENSLKKSFERLNSSMAIVDLLSRDLAVSEMSHHKDNKPATIVKANQRDMIVKQSKSIHAQKKIKHPISIDPRLSALILLPLLHVPHILIATAFDTLSTYDNDIPSAAETGSNLSGLFIWAFILAITNLMVDKAIIVPAPFIRIGEQKKLNCALLPGSFTDSTFFKAKHKKSHYLDSQSLMHQQHLKQVYLEREHPAVHMQHPLSHPNISFPIPNDLSLKRRNSL